MGSPVQLDWRLVDILSDLQQPAISRSSQGLVFHCQRGDVNYVVKLRDTAEQTQREIDFLERAGELSVEVAGYIRRGNHELIGFVMPCLRVIKPLTMTVKEKTDVFHQIQEIIPKLHERGIIHGDIKLSNMLLHGHKLKLCDFGTSALMSEDTYPTAISIRWCSPYRLQVNSDNRVPLLIPEEDVYAAGIAVWELFTGQVPFADIDSDDDEADLEGRIRSGLVVDSAQIPVEDARLYLVECLNVFSHSLVTDTHIDSR
jgi:serine/threonine protein kinase